MPVAEVCKAELPPPQLTTRKTMTEDAAEEAKK